MSADEAAGADTGPSWPPLPELTAGDPQAEVKKILYQAQVQLALARRQAGDDARKATRAADDDREHAAWDAEYTNRQAVDTAYIDVTKGAIDRAQARGQFIQTAAAAIGTAYAAVLALSFKVDGTGSGATALPVQGIVSTAFLGLAIVLATVYVSWISRHGDAPGPQAGASLVQDQAERRKAFINWATPQIASRLYYLHTSIVALAIGVALLPLAYVRMGVGVVVAVTLAGVVVVFAAPLVLGDR